MANSDWEPAEERSTRDEAEERPVSEAGWRGGWRIEALTRISNLREWVPTMLRAQPKQARRLQQRLTEAERHVLDARHSLTTWVRGAEIEHVWTMLHEIEEELVRQAPADPRVADVVRIHEAELPRRRRPPGPVPKDELLRVAHAWSAQHNRYLRSVRNRTLLAAGTAFALWAALLGVQALLGSSVALVAGPENTDLQPEVLLVLTLVGGAVGGALTALRLLGARPRGRYDVAVPRALLRISTGGVTGFLGVLLLSSGWIVTGTLTSVATLLVVAVAFGVAQDRLTRALEQRADDLLASGAAAPGREAAGGPDEQG